jgi:putative transposase
MAWGCVKVEEQRELFIKEFVLGKDSISQLCKKYYISRKTAYKWYHRFLLLEEEGLKDLSKAPHSPYTVYSDWQIDLALEYKRKHLSWGPKKILVKLQQAYPEMRWPSPTRLYEIFRENHLVSKRRLKNRVPATAPLGDLINCNDTWAMDLKGWFLTANGRKCEPFTVTDCHSRYLIHCMHLHRHTADHIWPVFEKAFYEYGLPNRVRSDNGPPFGSTGVGRLTSLSVKLIKAGVIPEWINPGHPEENGRHERFHLTLQQGVANPPKATLKDQLAALQAFQQEYNFERPHEALNMQTPGSCYTPSSRRWDGVFRSPEYDTKQSKIRKVGQNGCIWVSQEEFYIGQVLAGEYVALQESIDGEIELFYGPVRLGKFDPRTGLEKPKSNIRKKKRQ